MVKGLVKENFKRDKRSPKPKSLVVSRVMSANRAKHTRTEKSFRKALRDMKLGHYKLYSKKISGRPDVVFMRAKLAVFVHGCYWHHCPKCDFPIPKHNRLFWKAKFERNRERDARKIRELRRAGWRALVIWEHEVKKNAARAALKVKRKLDALQ